MKIVHIKDKLVSMGVALDGIIMGDFDMLGEFTAKRTRTPNDPNYKKFGATYRSNYERGILVDSLIRQHGLTSVLEIGFGRGYVTFCAAKAFHDLGIQGTVHTIDPNLEEKYVKQLQGVLPPDLFKHIKFYKGLSRDVVPTIPGTFDLVYIDGDHSYAATKHDWEMTKDRFNQFLLFDDYHLPTKQDSGTIECSKAIDEIDHVAEACKSPELIRMDRRMFVDERGFSDDQIDYGQVLLTKQGVADVW